MAIIGNCIKTGACVHFVEYGNYVVCDLFAVGDAVVIYFPGGFNAAIHRNPPRPVTHNVYIGSGFLDKNSGHAIVTSCCCQSVEEKRQIASWE